MQVSTPVPYIVVGSHDPTKIISLDSPGFNGSATGNNSFGYPYHSTSKNADELRGEVEAVGGVGSVLGITRFLASSDGAITYAGLNILKKFSLKPGEGYTVQDLPEAFDQGRPMGGLVLWAVDFGMITAQITVRPLGIHKSGYVSKGPRVGGPVGTISASSGAPRSPMRDLNNPASGFRIRNRCSSPSSNLLSARSILVTIR